MADEEEQVVMQTTKNDPLKQSAAKYKRGQNVDYKVGRYGKWLTVEN